MKKFINKTLAFLMPFVLLLFFLYNLDSVILKLNFPKNITTLIVGDSHSECGIIDSLLLNSKNISQSGETFFFSYQKIKRIWKYHKFDTLIISYSPHNLTHLQDNKTLGTDSQKFYKELYPRYLRCLDVESMLFIINKSEVGILSSFSNFIKSTLKNYFQFNITYLGSYRGSYNSNLSDKDITDKVRIHFYDEKQVPYKESNIEPIYLNKIVDFSRENNIQAILVNLPVHPKYKEQIPMKIENYYHSSLDLFVKNNVRIYNFEKICYPDSCYGDGDHLNTYGAKLLTIELIDNLKKENLSFGMQEFQFLHK